MVQLLESTKSYLRNSTKLGRRMSQYKHEMSSSETSLPPEKETAATTPTLQRSSMEKSPSRASQSRLSGLFSITRSNSNGSSTRHSTPSPVEERPSSGLFPRKIGPDTAETHAHVVSDDKRRNSKSSDRTHATTSDKSQHSGSHDNNSGIRRHSHRVSVATSPGKDASNGDIHQHRGSQILDCDRRRSRRVHSQYDEVPRGRSPTWSMSNTISTATSSYHTRPSDYPSMKHYQAHVWRRQLLEESIMHSLKLGYADRNRPVTRQRSRSLKQNSRARKAKEQAMLAAALGKDLPESPTTSRHPHGHRQQQKDGSNDSEDEEGTEEVTSRSMDVLKPLPQIKNSPYITQTNPSMLNITQSFASFTLELNENDVHRVMSSSAVPNLFRIKQQLGPGTGSRPHRDSKTKINPSPLSNSPHAPGKESDSTLTSPTADWAKGVFVSLDKHLEGSATDLPATSRDDPSTKDIVHVAAATAV
ncbi:hypothetical protein BGW41_007744 [Actinomortierella wolfii]|nr:hypothetical protein BGW41_007744 [Actinomortierella wolfii]